MNHVEDGHIGKGETEKEAKKRKLREQRIARAKRRRITKALEEITGDKSLAERVCLLPELKSSIMAMLGYLKTPILASKNMMSPLRHVLSHKGGTSRSGRAARSEVPQEPREGDIA